jgi:hypothetical protein
MNAGCISLQQLGKRIHIIEISRQLFRAICQGLGHSLTHIKLCLEGSQVFLCSAVVFLGFVDSVGTRMT